MEIDDFMEPEIAVTAAVAAAIFSPRARKVMRKGLVYGMAGILTASDAVTSFARSVSQGMQQAGEATPEAENQGKEMENGTETEKETETTPALRRKTGAKVARRAEGQSS